MISEICFEQIKDNYWYGLYGDFRVVMDKTNGYVNATKMCRAGGKDYKDWSGLKGSQQLMQTLEVVNSGNAALENIHVNENALQGTPGRFAHYDLQYVKFFTISIIQIPTD